ncbi:MAG: ABC transporter ATP-binding protein, partial [Oscillatoriales cyanobacterium SM2_1_8]|nr:ABC transporter ATP-binding protein [Oscillatoriales cyanobacterium SM2_1_8]
MLTVEGVAKAYGDRPVLQDVSFTLHRGEIYGLLGPNGAGKTTILEIVAGLVTPDRGTVHLDGQPISAITKTQIGVAPQRNLLYGSLTCQENLEFFGSLYGLSGGKLRRQVAFCLEAVNLKHCAHRPVEALSGGTVRRVNIAVALVHSPKLAILDEPTTGIDIETQQEIWQALCRLRDSGLTILLTTHFLAEAERLCRRLGILKEGRLLAEGTLAELQRYIPAARILTLETPHPTAAIARCVELGLVWRERGHSLDVWLPTPQNLNTALANFANLTLDGAALHPVTLDRLYLEITRSPLPAAWRLPKA